MRFFDWFRRKKKNDPNDIWNHPPILSAGSSSSSNGITRPPIDILKDYLSYLQQDIGYSIKSIDSYRQCIVDTNARIDVMKKAIPEYEALIKKLEEK